MEKNFIIICKCGWKRRSTGISDKKNGWDGISDFSQQREKLIQENLVAVLQERRLKGN